MGGVIVVIYINAFMGKFPLEAFVFCASLKLSKFKEEIE
jgi:hypothetical protein